MVAAFRLNIDTGCSEYVFTETGGKNYNRDMK